MNCSSPLCDPLCFFFSVFVLFQLHSASACAPVARDPACAEHLSRPFRAPTSVSAAEAGSLQSASRPPGMGDARSSASRRCPSSTPKTHAFGFVFHQTEAVSLFALRRTSVKNRDGLRLCSFSAIIWIRCWRTGRRVCQSAQPSQVAPITDGRSTWGLSPQLLPPSGVGPCY